MRLDKAVPKHFHDTRSKAADLVFVPFKRIKAGDRHTLRHFEHKTINDFNMIAAGINRSQTSIVTACLLMRNHT